MEQSTLYTIVTMFSKTLIFAGVIMLIMWYITPSKKKRPSINPVEAKIQSKKERIVLHNIHAQNKKIDYIHETETGPIRTPKKPTQLSDGSLLFGGVVRRGNQILNSTKGGP